MVTMKNLRNVQGLLACMVLVCMGLTACQPSQSERKKEEQKYPPAQKKHADKKEVSAAKGTAKAEDVAAAKALIEKLGPANKCVVSSHGALTEILVDDGAGLSAASIELFGRLSDLEKLQIYDFRSLNDEMVAKLSSLKKLTVLALTNSVISDATVGMIAKSFPNLVDLDLSSNTNMTNSAMKVICGLSKLERLTLVQNRFNDVSTGNLKRIADLRALDLRGNMEAGDMTMEVIGGLPKLTALKHRSTAVTDSGIESLAKSSTLESLLMQDFVVTGQAGQHIAKLGKLTQLEIFRCQGFGSDGVQALKGMKLSRLTLRDLPAVDDSALAVFTDLPELKKLFLHEISSIGDSGLANLASLKSLELLDIWTVPQMTDATIDVIAGLPNLKELSIRTTGVTDAAVDKLIAMKSLQTLTFKDNGSVTPEGLTKLATRKWTKLDTGAPVTQ